MDISLRLWEPKPGRLVYSIPRWYRTVMIVISLILVASIIVSEGAPGAIAWIIAAIAVLAAAYEERWIIDRGEGHIRHRFGLVFLARTVDLPFDRIEGFRLRAFVRGTNPGAPGAAEESARILNSLDPMGDATLLKDGRSRYRKAYVTLLCDDLEGGALVINTLPARRASELRADGMTLAAAAGKKLIADN